MATAPEQPHQMQTPVHCDTCENTAKHLCKSCHDRLCDRCKDIHSKSKATFDHEVVLLTFESLTLSSESPSHVVCKWHPKFRASIGCQNCEVPVCEKCLLGEHNGHKVIEFSLLFQYKKEKLDQKLSAVLSELPKYESKLENVRVRQKIVSENNYTVKNEIVAYFKKLFSTLDASKHRLLNSVDLKTKADLNILKNQENDVQNYIQTMQEYMANIQNEDSQERISFILYNVRVTDNTFPRIFQPCSVPGMMKYSDGHFDKVLVQTITGRVYNGTENTKLLDTDTVQLIKGIELGKGVVLSLASCLEAETFWVFLSGKNAFERYEKGILIEEIKEINRSSQNKPICLVKNENLVLFRKDYSTILMLEDPRMKLLLDVTPLAIVCICPTKDDELYIGLVNAIEKHFAIGRFNLIGECKYYITPMHGKWSSESIFTDDKKLYINENLNGDICLSMGTVHVLCANGDHRFTYDGQEASMSQPFLPRGICTDVLGHILIADENNNGIHVLDKDGKFQTILKFPGESLATPISLCVDSENNLYIGCKDGKIRILKYLD